ncbi:IS3 family transposase [Streptomyces wuyuanensis]|uniref:IS3 family transposase n=1 Tax=Streptomyces wuyuanensis TaxID=1196353 RepID=UPI00379AC96A
MRRANEILKALGVFREGPRPAPHEADAVIDHLRDGFGVEPACWELGLSVSADNAHRRRPKFTWRLRDEQLLTKIRAVHAASGETCGARRIHRQLPRERVTAARCTVERLMCEDGLEGVVRGRRRRTTVPEPAAPRPPDLVNLQFTASRPNQLWVADLTYVRTRSGWVHVAFVLDVHSRMIVGWLVQHRAPALRTRYLPPEEFEAAFYRTLATPNAA